MRRHLPDSRRALPLLLAAALALALAVPVRAQGVRPSTAQEMLLGLILDGREVLVVDGYFDGEQFSLPVAAFEQICECRTERRGDGGLVVATGLGQGVLPGDELAAIDGVPYVNEATLRRLAVTVIYDPARLALILDLPWRGTSLRRGTDPLATAVPDVRAPSTTLSSSIFRLEHTRQSGYDSSTGSVLLMGRAGGGLWQARYEDRFDGGSRSLSEYAWLRRFDDTLVLAGHQRVNLHPLLGNIELTGVQGAWTNQPLDVFAEGPDPTELVPRELRSTRTITGIGVAAGTAVLRIDDRNVAVQRMGLDGRYEFRDVPVAGAVASRVEVLIFERHDPTAPVDIHDHTGSSSRAVLPAGALVMQGGLGDSGNLADPRFSTAGLAGFYQARVGVSTGLTLEGAVQRSRWGDRAMVGGTAQLGRNVAADFAAARGAGAGAYMLDVEGRWGGWRVVGRSQVRQAGFDTVDAPLRQQHLLEISRRGADGSWEAGLIAQHRRGVGVDSTFVLPWMYWRPDARLMLRARPDSDGRYRLDGSWIPALDWRVGVSRSGDHAVADLDWRPGGSVRTSLVAERVDSGAHREAALLTWIGDSAQSPSVSAGPLISNGRVGVLVSAQLAPVPGMILGARYESSPVLDRPDRARDQRISLVLSGNLSFAGNRVLPGGYTPLHGATGGIGGRLRIAGEYAAARGVLAGVAIRVDGRPVTRTVAGGRFHVSNLSPGVHRLELDPAGLPVELSPREGSLLVEVEGGAVTRADLPLDVEFGIAGRVRTAGVAAEGVRLELVDSSAAVVATGTTDRWGLYRLDGVAPGQYLLRAEGAETGEGRRIVVRDDFLFEQNLDLAPPRTERSVQPSDSGRAAVDLPAAVGTEIGAAADLATATSPPAMPMAAETVVVRGVAPGPELVGVPVLQAGPIGPADGRLRFHEYTTVSAAAPPVDLVRVSGRLEAVPALAGAAPVHAALDPRFLGLLRDLYAPLLPR